MRESEISVGAGKYTKKTRKRDLKRPLLFLLYFFAAVSLFLAFLWRNEWIITIFFTTLCFLLSYHTNFYTLRIDVGQEVFLSMLLTYEFGIVYGLFLLFVGELIPDLITARLDKDTFMSFVFSIVACFLMIIISKFELSFVAMGAILVTAKFVASIALDLVMESDPEEMVFETGLNYLVNIVLFVGFGGYFLGLLN